MTHASFSIADPRKQSPFRNKGGEELSALVVRQRGGEVKYHIIYHMEQGRRRGGAGVPV